MTATPRLALPNIFAQQAQKEVTHAATMNRLDALVLPVVQQVGLNTPPGSPADGQCWIVGTAPTGAWAWQANKLAQRIGGAWAFHAPFVGLIISAATAPFAATRDGQPVLSACQCHGMSSSMRLLGHPLTRRVSTSVK